MASDEDKIGALAASLLGLGMGALIGTAMANRSDPRAMFMNRLRAGLEPTGLTLAAADLGQGLKGPVWILTLQLPDGSLMPLQAPVDPGIDPLAPQVSDAIAQRIIAYLRPYGLLRHDARP